MLFKAKFERPVPQTQSCSGLAEVLLSVFGLDGLLVSGDEQDKTISALLEICIGLARPGFYGDVLYFSTHVNLHGWTANLHGKVDFSYTEREKDKHTLLYYYILKVYSHNLWTFLSPLHAFPFLSLILTLFPNLKLTLGPPTWETLWYFQNMYVCQRVQYTDIIEK